MKRLALIFALLLVSTPAYADDYGRLVDEALAEYDAGHFEESLALFEHAYQARPSARAKRGVAKALFELRAYARCIAAIDAALAGTVDPLPGTLADELKALRERALRFVGKLTVVVTPAASTVLVDGRPLATADLVLETGPHTIDASQPGYESAHRTIDVRPATTSRIVLSLTPVARATEAPHERSVAPVALLFTGGGLSLAGIVASSLWYADRSSAIDQCRRAAANGARCANGDGVLFQRDAAAVTIGLSAAALVASGIGLYVTLRKPTDTRMACTAYSSELRCGLGGTW